MQSCFLSFSSLLQLHKAVDMAVAWRNMSQTWSVALHHSLEPVDRWWLAQAEAQSRAIFLISSNINNTAFYESCGFSVVGEYSLGDDNPSWTEAPVIVRLVSDVNFYYIPFGIFLTVGC